MLTCSKCLIQKPDDAFYKNAGAKNGLTTQCKECSKKAHARYANEIRAVHRRAVEGVRSRNTSAPVTTHRPYGMLVKKGRPASLQSEPDWIPVSELASSLGMKKIPNAIIAEWCLKQRLDVRNSRLCVSRKQAEAFRIGVEVGRTVGDSMEGLAIALSGRLRKVMRNGK